MHCCRFNTSHVTLYRIWIIKKVQGTRFQYISCYSLSNLDIITANLGLCFNTSHVTLYHQAGCANNSITAVSIHLMLLFIRNLAQHTKERCAFQYISCYSLSKAEIRFGRTTFVSIHLMLLFIPFPVLYTLNLLLFQYISCYSLSSFAKSPIRIDVVSIHLMLLFIQMQTYKDFSEKSFNTSHVTLYPSTLQHFSHLTFL